MIINSVSVGGAGKINIDDIQPYLDGAHIEFAATQGDNTLHLRTQTAGYNCTIHWGDGSETKAPANGGNVVHNYATAKTYHIFITGKSFAGFNVSNQQGKEKYVAIHSMGKWAVNTATNFERCFYGCTSLTTLPADLFRYNTAVTTFRYCFYDCTSLTSLPADLFRYNTAATNFSYSFHGCTSLTSLPADLFRYNKKAIAFGDSFSNCTSLTSLPADLFRYNTAVVAFDYCFSSCTSLTSLPADLFRYNTAATSFECCFAACTSLTTLPADLFRYNTAATTFRYCFSACYSLTSLPADLFRYNTAAVAFERCFFVCTSLTLRADIFGTDYSTRFSGKTIELNYCFSRTSFTGNQGTAPELWNFTFDNVSFTSCFGGAGNSVTSLSNYSSIPTAWK